MDEEQKIDPVTGLPVEEEVVEGEMPEMEDEVEEEEDEEATEDAE